MFRRLWRMIRRGEKQNNDYLTRLGSRELAHLQDVARNGVIAARMDLAKALRSLGDASEKLDRIEARLKEASNPHPKR